MASLVISLSLITPIFAQPNTIFNATVTGIDGTAQYHRQDDILTYKVIVETNDTVEPDQIKVNNVVFGRNFCNGGTSCAAYSSPTVVGQECTCTDSSFIPEDPYGFTFYYFTPGVSDPLDVFGPVMVYPEELPPTITLFNITQGNKKVTANISVADTACQDPECEGKCTGISYLEIYANGDVVGLDRPNTQNCSYATGLVLDGVTSGETDLYVRVYDLFSQATESDHIRYTIDLEDPALESVSILDDQSGEEVRYISLEGNREQVVDVEVVFREENLVESIADLSYLNDDRSFAESYKAIPFPNSGAGIQVDCETSEETYTCTFERIHLKMNSESAVLRFNLTDVGGNNVAAEQTVTFTIDDSGPEGLGIQSGMCINEACFLGPDSNNLTIVLQSPGAGFTKTMSINNQEVHYVTVDLSGFMGSAWQRVGSNDCTAAGELWSCRWYNLRKGVSLVSGRTVDIFLTTPSQDDAGNPIEGEIRGSFVYDETPPEILSITVATDEGKDYFKDGDTLLFTAEIEEIHSQVAEDGSTTSGDFSRIKPGAIKIPADQCSPKTINNTQTCTWTITDVRATSGEVSVKFSISDMVGNTATQETTLRIYGVSTEEFPDHFTNTVSFIPDNYKLDALTAQRFPLKAFAVVHLREKAGASINGDDLKAVVREQCNYASEFSDEPYLYADPVYDPSLDEWTAVLRIDFKTTDFSEIGPEVPFDCIFYLDYIYQEQALRNPELENVSFAVQIYNVPLDSVDDAFLDKINEHRHWVRAGQEWVNGLNKLFTILNNICELEGVLSALYKLMAQTRAVVYAISGVIYAFDPPAAQNLWDKYNEIMCNIQSTKLTSIGKLFGKESSGEPTGGGKFLKQACAAVSCAQCDPNPQTNLWGGEVDSEGYTWNRFPGSDYLFDPETFLPFDKQITDSAQEKTGTEKNVRPIPTTEDLRNAFSAYPRPEDSIIVSIGCFCVPGIIYHLNRLQQLECAYVDCMAEQSKSGLQRFASCEEGLAIAQCVYTWGSIARSFGAFLVLERMAEWVQTILNHPTAFAIQQARGFVCADYNTQLSTPVCKASTLENPMTITNMGCALFDSYMTFADHESYTNNIASIFKADSFKNMFKGEDDICGQEDVKEVLDALEKREEDQEGGEEGGGPDIGPSG